jgi:hypothetical protein
MSNDRPLPAVLRIAAGVLLVQGAGLLVVGAVEVLAAVLGHPATRSTAVLLGALTMFYAVVVLLVGRGVARGRAAATTPALMVEFFAVVVGLGQVHTLLPLSVALLVTAVVALVALLHPDARSVLLRDR